MVGLRPEYGARPHLFFIETGKDIKRGKNFTAMRDFDIS